MALPNPSDHFSPSSALRRRGPATALDTALHLRDLAAAARDRNQAVVEANEALRHRLRSFRARIAPPAGLSVAVEHDVPLAPVPGGAADVQGVLDGHEPWTQDVAPFRVSSVTVSDHVVVEPVGELDIATAPVLEARLCAHLCAGQLHVVVDLSGLTFVDCGGLRMLARVADDATARGGSLRLSRPSELVTRLLSVTGFGAALRVR